MLEHVLLSPVSFFDVTPRGAILNRFTTDLNDIDTRFAVLGRQAIQTLLLVLARVGVLGTESTVLVVVSGIVIIGFTIGMGILTRAANAARFLRTTLFSKLLQHATESIESLSLVRTFGANERCYARFCRLANQNARATSAWLACNRTLRMFTTTCGLLIVLTTLGSVVGDSSAPPDGSAIGLALSSSLSVGIVGRTGAGKSSLVLALLRVLKSTGGRLLIDGVDIASVPLPRLRGAITAIAQMDGDTDRLIQATLRESFAGSTVLTVAHRIHTVLDYDRIIVMNGGRIVENAPVAELLSNKDSIFFAMAAKAGVSTESYRQRHRMLCNTEVIRL
ncbi:hypothetical protein V5799_000706 [Amblyomma americanum]|uniref:ABC transmembrane type-1 domain-containing protein n=1 Tax=Amblyomma americanum TaxID=6943 RepID=A0AAQ4D2A2_AMBAM